MNRLIVVLIPLLALSLLVTVLAFSTVNVTTQRGSALLGLVDQQLALSLNFEGQALAASAGNKAALADLAATAHAIAEGMKTLESVGPESMRPMLDILAEDWRALDEDRARIVGASTVVEQIAVLRGPMRRLTAQDGPVVRLLDRRVKSADDSSQHELPLATAVAGLQIALMQLEHPEADTADTLLGQVGTVRDALKSEAAADAPAEGDESVSSATTSLHAQAADLQSPLSILSGNSVALRQMLLSAQDIQNRQDVLARNILSLKDGADLRAEQGRRLLLIAYGSAALALLILALLALILARAARRAAHKEAEGRAAWISLREEVDSMTMNPARRADTTIGQAGVAASINRLLDTWRKVLVPLRPMLAQTTQASAHVFQSFKQVRSNQEYGHSELAASVEPLYTLAGEAHELARLAQRCVAAAEREHSRPSLLYEKLAHVSELLANRLIRQSELLKECAGQLEQALASVGPDETPTHELLTLVRSIQALKVLESRLPTAAAQPFSEPVTDPH